MDNILFKAIGTVLLYAKSNNLSMKTIYQDLWFDLENLPNADFTSNNLENIQSNPNVTIKTLRKSIKQADFKYEWKFVVLLRIFALKINQSSSNSFHDWTSDRPGTFLIKGLNLFMVKGVCNHLRNEAVNEMKKIFAIPSGKGVSFPEMIFLYSVTDFKMLIKNVSRPFKAIPSLLDMNTTFIDCFKHVALMNKIPTESHEGYFHDETNIGNEKSICFNKKIPVQCNDYCMWHKNVVEKMVKKDFVQIMKYGMSQRKLFLENEAWERDMASTLFGKENVQHQAHPIAPTSPIVFCHRKDQGFSGDHVGMYARLCNDFFITPSTSGMTFTQNMDVQNILKIDQVYESTIEYMSKQRSKPKTYNGVNEWKDMTLVLDSDSITHLGQTYRHGLSVRFDSFQLQVHQSKDLASFILENNSDVDLKPIRLENGYEYTINVYPYGQISTDEFKSLGQKQRKCKLDTDLVLDGTGILKRYTENNCKFSCHVSLTEKKCGCRPWNYLGELVLDECDVFGRICFEKSMQILAESSHDKCKQCKKECDFIKFKKVLEKRTVASIGQNGKYFKTVKGKVGGSQPFIEFLLDNNNTMIDKGLRNAYDFMGSVGSFEKDYPTANNHELIIVHLKFMQPDINIIGLKYSVFDMIGTFGGQLGILEKLTGASLLGMINLLLILVKVIFAFFKRD